MSIAWGDAVAGLRMGLALGGETYAVGDPVRAAIFFENLSDETVEIVETHVLHDYEIEVLRDGLPVPWTAAGRDARQNARTLPPKRRRTVRVPPGEVHRVDQPLDLHEWFEVDRPALYAARARERTARERPALSSGAAGFEVV